MQQTSDLIKYLKLNTAQKPKLSKDFKPTVIYDILKQSLNTLSDDDLSSMGEAMDNMDSLNLRFE